MSPLALSLFLAAPAGDATTLLQRAALMYDTLEYDAVVPLAAAVLALPDISLEQRLRAHMLKASALAIIGDPIEAEVSFRLLLRAQPGFELPEDTPPKIVAVFRTVQVEERALRDRMREIERARVLASLALDGGGPGAAVGGVAIPFEYRLRDPQGVVKAVQLRYRRRGEPLYSALTLARDDQGVARGEIAGELTENDGGLVVEYYAATVGHDGEELLLSGTARAPARIDLEAGRIVPPVPFYRTTWFWGLVSGGVLAAGVAGWAIYDNATSLPEGSHGVVSLD